MQVATSRPPEAIELDGAFNARIVAWYDDGHPRLIRSSALDHLTQNGIHELARLGVTTIIDLREPERNRHVSFPASVLLVCRYITCLRVLQRQVSWLLSTDSCLFNVVMS